MIDSAARAERFEPAPSLPPCYTWEVPQKPVLVRLPLPLIDRLEREAVENFRSVSSRGSEIGGVLWGTVDPGEPASLLVVEYEMVPCAYTRGPLYRLSESDLGQLDQILAKNDSGLQPVGFFRSHTRKGLSLDSDDLLVMDARFKEAHQIALVIRPYATKASTAGIFLRENGQIHSEASYLEFPFRSSQLAPSKHLADAVDAAGGMPSPPAPAKPTVRAQIVPIASRRDIAAVPPLAAEPTPVPVSQPAPQAVPQSQPMAQPMAPLPQPVAQEIPQPVAQSQPIAQSIPPAIPQPASHSTAHAAEVRETAPVEETAAFSDAGTNSDTVPEETAAAPATPAKAKGGNRLIWFAVGAVFPILLSGVLFVYPGVFRHASLPGISGQDSSPLALRVERTGSELLLTWNNDSSAIRNATRAVLSISDGEQHENVEMDLAQLRNGRIEYLPVTSDVVFKMEVSGKDNTKTASESVRVLRTRPSPMPPDSQNPPAPATASKSPATPNAAPTTPATSLAAPPNSPAPNPATTAETASANQLPASAPAPTPLKTFNTASLSERLRPVHSDDIALPDAPNVGGASVSASDAALKLTAMAPPALPAALRKNEPNAPAKQGAVPTGGDVQQAQLIFRKNPDYPSLARSAGAKGTVELVATIGTNGRVKTVKMLKGHPLLQKAAIDAVMQWQYRPTMLNGHPVETETTITLNFVNDR